MDSSMEDISVSGYLEIIMGPMFSGKTTRIIELHKQYTYCNIPVILINHVSDVRYGENNMITTHDQHSIKGYQTSCLKDFITLNEQLYSNSRAILINEGQFFPDLYETVLRMVEKDGKRVHIAGLDGDFKRNLFGSLNTLIPVADKITKLFALCAICKNGSKALFSHRIVENDSQVMVGSSIYQPLCRKCYLQNNST